MGDNVYADGSDMQRKRRAYAELGRIPGYVALKRTTRVLATWDDHDYGYNDVGGEYRAKRASQRVFLDFFEEPADSPRRGTPGVYAAYEVGPPERRLQIILLDTRYFRSRLEPVPRVDPKKRNYRSTRDTTKTMLGAEQWAWLEDQLRRPARVRLLVSSIQVLPVDITGERWDAFPHERSRLFRLVRDTSAGGVVLLSGDRHYTEVARLPAGEGGPGYPLYEFTSSGMNSVWEHGARTSVNRYRLGRTHALHNFGLVLVDWDLETVRVELRDETGRELSGHTIEFDEIDVAP